MLQRGALWHNVIRRKYGEEEGGWRTCEVGGAIRSWPGRLYGGRWLGSMFC